MIAAWLSLQLALAALTALALALDRLGLEPRAWTRAVRGWIVVAPLVVLGVPQVPQGYAPPSPMAAAAPSVARAARRASAELPAAARTVPAAIPWGTVLLALLAGSVAHTALGAAHLQARLGGTSRVRRIGRVEIRVAAEGPCCAIAWGRRAVVIVDRATWRDPDARAIVVRHELAHHRHRDPQWAWVWAGLSTVALPHPLINALRRRAAAVEELAVDQAVVRTVAPARYAEVLLAAASRPAPPLSLAVPALTHPLHERLSMLARPRSRRAPAWLLAALGVGAALTAAARPAAVDLDLPALAADASTPAFPVAADPAVAEQLARITASDQARRFFGKALRNRADHADIDRALAAAGLPAQLAAVPLIESGFQNLPAPEGESMAPPGPMGAGLWMFIPSTARVYGLRVDDAVDERLDGALETEAAVALLTDLHARYGDWALALAGYNQGERHVDAAIEAHATRDAWALIAAGALNDYAARVMAAAIVLEHPELVR
jgi:membrane-bound lytic murein transglycosylase D